MNEESKIGDVGSRGCSYRHQVYSIDKKVMISS